MNKAYQKKRHPRSRISIGDEVVQLTLDPNDLLREMQEGLHQFAVNIGLELVQLFMEQEIDQLCGTRYGRPEDREATRHGGQPGVITIGGQKMSIHRPRARSSRGTGEVALKTYEMAQRDEAMPRAVLQRLVRGVSCRDYQGVIDLASEGFGVTRSSVSRQFETASKEKIRELCERRFDDERIVVIFIDGVGFADTTMITALGMTEDGKKLVLGFREGATENSLVCKSLLADLVERGLDSSKPALFVVDGGKALRKAINEVWGDLALVQRCRAHKKRNVQAHVPERHWPEVERMLDAAWHQVDHKKALKKLQTLAAYLDRISPDAAGSLREGMDETITVIKLRLDPALSVHLHTTNPIENVFSVARKMTNRVKRWRDGQMKSRWCATALLHAETGFRRIKGFRHMPQLVTALDTITKRATVVRKTA